MRVTILHIHYKTPESGGALRSYFIAQGLASMGHQVDVITASNNTSYSLNVEGNLKVHMLPVKYDNHFGFIKRIVAFLLFNKKARRLLATLPKPDLLYCISTPLTVGLLGIKVKQKWGIPFFFEVGDLWPEAPIQMGVIKSPWLKKWLYQMERRIYMESKGIIALSPSIRDSIIARFPEKPVYTIPNMADREFFRPTSDNSDQLMPEKNLIIGCIGAVGKANHLDFLIRTAELCQYEIPQIGFVIMGEGSEMSRLRFESSNLSNVTVLPFSNREIVRQVISQLDAIYISFLNIPVLETGSPNKFFDGLAAGKMVILNFKGWIAELVEENDCGFSYDPTNPVDFVDRIKLYLDPEILMKSQNNARKLAVKFDKSHLIEKLNEILSTP